MPTPTTIYCEECSRVRQIQEVIASNKEKLSQLQTMSDHLIEQLSVVVDPVRRQEMTRAITSAGMDIAVLSTDNENRTRWLAALAAKGHKGTTCEKV